jgi:hypothetical protein
MAAGHNTLDRFSLTNPLGTPVPTGVKITLELDLNVLTEELVDRLDEGDLVSFLVGIAEAYDDLDTTELVLNKLGAIHRAQEEAALRAREES